MHHPAGSALHQAPGRFVPPTFCCSRTPWFRRCERDILDWRWLEPTLPRGQGGGRIKTIRDTTSMDHRCPHCCASLAWKLLSPRAGLLARWPDPALLCTECGAAVIRNVHPRERRSHVVIVACVPWISVALSMAERHEYLPGFMAVVICVTAAMASVAGHWWWVRRPLRDWPRYRIPFGDDASSGGR